MGNLVLAAFCTVLCVFIFSGLPILGALVIGFFLFAGFALQRGLSVSAVVRLAWAGIYRVRTLLVVFLFIGMLTGLWRASGTIAYIIAEAVGAISPSVFLLLAFLFNCGISFLLGSAFAASATMGVITFSIGQSLGISPVLSGGVILSGVYFGDRMSPVSTSAFLVSVLTGTDLYQNIRNMALSALVPFVISCPLYLAIGFGAHGHTVDIHVLTQPLEELYTFTPWLLLPAGSILALSLFRVSVKWNMLVSIALAFLLAVIIQHRTPLELVSIMAAGFHTGDAATAHMLDGGGILSMLNVTAIVCLSSSFSDIFKATGMLDGVESLLGRVYRKAGAYPAVLAASVFTAAISCNQTLTLILTHQLCGDFVPRRETLALYLENTAEVVCVLIPWGISCVLVLDTVGAPSRMAILAAFYLILIPLWGLVRRPRM